MRRLVLIAICLACLPMTGLAQDNFPDVPDGHVSYKAVQMLRARGLMANTGDRFVRTSAAELARQIIHGIDVLPTTLAKRLEMARRSGTAAADRDEVVLFASRWRQGFRDAVTHLEPDIRKAGRDPGKLLRSIDANEPLAAKIVGVLTHSAGQRGDQSPFSDVPATHWAAKAVQELKDAGILVGYPDGHFLESGSG